MIFTAPFIAVATFLLIIELRRNYPKDCRQAILVGRGIREATKYADEVALSKKCGYDFNQVWFFNGDMLIGDNVPDKAAYIKSFNFPIIIHAMFTLDDFTKFGGRLVELVKYFGHKEVIVHATGKIKGGAAAVKDANLKLRDLLADLNATFKKLGVRVYVENNDQRLHNICGTKEQLETMLSSGVELLMDTGHVDSYEHIAEIIKLKRPACLHLANKRFSAGHEHLPLSRGDIDFGLFFSKYLPNYTGRIIVEVGNEFATDQDFEESKKVLDKVFK